MVITPQTDVYLLQVPLEIDSNHQLTFANATAQFNYFFSLPKIGFDGFTYQRKDNSIRVPALFDNIMNYNYVMYRNDAYSNKWFYAYITDMVYKNDSNTDVYIKTDVWQTYQFDLTFKPVLIDREHVNDDTVGKHTLPEGLELGDVVANGRTKNFGFDLTQQGALMLIADVSMIENYGTNQTLVATWDSGSTPISSANGIPSGTYHIVISTGTLSLTGLQHFVSIYDKAGLSDAIQSVYILPTKIVGTNDIKSGLTLSTTGSAPADSISGLGMISSSLRDVTHIGTATCNVPTSVDGYIPVNKKVLTYPFNYLNVSNNAGTVIPYRYEDFVLLNNAVRFEVDGVFCESGSIKAVPRDYKNLSYDAGDNRYDYSINGAKYPVCSWNSDSYTNWLTQNAVNMETQWKNTLIGAGVNAVQNVVHGALTEGTVGAGMGLIASGVQTVSGIIGLAREQHLAKTQANLVPDQARGNLGAGDIVFSKHGSLFTFMPMSIKKEYAVAIDQYFSQYGYKCNLVKVPNITGRRNWNYVKTVGCYIEANIPQEDLQEIKLMFDKGITLWHNPATFADYTQNNDII